MNIKIDAHNTTLKPEVKEFAQKRLERLERYLPNIQDIRMDLREEKTRTASIRSHAQITIRHQRGALLRSEVSIDGDLQAAVQQVIDRMYRQIERFKGKQQPKGRERFSATVDELEQAEPLPIEGQDDEENEDAIIVRRKAVQITTMTDYEAVEQMELLGHTFFIFENAEVGGVNVVYKRKNGGYGLLMPGLD